MLTALEETKIRNIIKNFSSLGSGTGLTAIAAHTILGNNAGSSAIPVGLTDSQVKTLLSIADTDISFTDNTTNNVSASKHGYMPKYPNNTSTFFRGDGSYAIAGPTTQNVIK